MWKAAVGGLVGGGLVLGVLVYGKVTEIKQMTANAEAAAAGDAAARSALARQAAGIPARLGAYAEAETLKVVDQTAKQYLADVYGLTPERMARLG